MIGAFVALVVAPSLSQDLIKLEVPSQKCGVTVTLLTLPTFALRPAYSPLLVCSSQGVVGSSTALLFVRMSCYGKYLVHLGGYQGIF